MRIAVCTMLYNEPEFLPIWLRYYGRELGLDNCFVIDHESAIFDKSIFNIRNLMRIARSPQDEVQRVQALSDFSAYLLNYYDLVIYTDIDELLVPDPTLYKGLSDFCQGTSLEVTTAIGLNLQHLVDEEPPFDFSADVISQRRWVRFVSAMCKPLLIRSRVRWTRGFHGCDRPVTFGDIYLLHLRNFDLPTSLKRLGRTRDIPRRTDADRLGAAHQRVEDVQATQWMRAAAGMPRKSLQSISPKEDPLQRLLKSIETADPTRLLVDVNAAELWELPPAFVGAI